MNKLQIYRASAGSGKTYLLTLTYLKSAFENSDNFSKILAVTFTNKAAEEMKIRILKKLNELINKGSKADYYTEISNHLQIKSETEFFKRAKSVRDQILHNYSSFNVNTIDSFVQRVVRSFSFEMNLNSTYDIELDRTKVIDELTEKLYENISENKELQNWLIKYADSKTEDNKNWNFKEDIKKLAEEIFKERFQSLYSSKNQNFDKKELLEFLSELHKIKLTFETKMSEFAKQYKQIIEDAEIDYYTLRGKFKTISDHFLKKIAKDKNYDDFTKAILNSVEGIEYWYAKNATKEIIAEITSVYDKLSIIITNYFNIFNNEHENYYTAVQIIKNFHSFGIINDLAGFLPEYRSENNVLLISDTTLLLKEIIGNNDAPFIYEKIGNRFKHILIDEFQDTSGFQWENFKPLITNSLSEGYNNLIVGDIKQSIYRWRDGNWKLLLSEVKKEIGEHYIEEKNLDTNWRSLENIVTFNNTIFELLPKILQNQYNEKLEEIKNEAVKETLIKENYHKILIDAYAEQIQKVPNTPEKKGGNVKICFLKKEEYEEQLSIQFPKIIDNLLKNDYKQPKDIGILVRTNKQAQKITEILTHFQNETSERANYKIISGDALYIRNASSVRILISALKYIDNPQDTVNKAQLIFEYQKLQYSITDYNKIFLSIENNTYKTLLPEDFFTEYNLFSQKELFELSEQLIKIFNLTDKKKEFAYIKTFQDTITEFTHKNYSDLSDFIDWWEDKGKNKSVQISDKTNAVTILTIHKSKGLSFDTVLVPYTNYNFDHSFFTAPFLWAKTENPLFNRFSYLPVKYSSKLSQTVFRKDYFDEMLFSYTDAVNLLYVAFTRAENDLFIFSPYSNPKSKQKHIIGNTGEALYHIINQENTIEVGGQGTRFDFTKYYNKETKVFEFNENYHRKVKTFREENDSTDMYENMYPNNLWQKKLKLKYNSEDFLLESIPEAEEKVNYGKLMHLIFQDIITDKDVETSVMRQYSEGLLTAEEARHLKLTIATAVSQENVKSWFDGTYQVLNEDALLTAEGNIRIPDRVLLSEKEIIVIDFKFGKHHSKYKNQIIEYQKLLEDYYNLPVHSYLYYPENKQIIKI